MKKYGKHIIMVFILLLMPILVFASSGTNEVDLLEAVFIEAFVTIHMSLFVLSPLSNLLSKENSKKTFWILFYVRIAVLLFFDLFVTTGIFIVDFMFVFIGAFGIVPLLGWIMKKNPYAAPSATKNNLVVTSQNPSNLENVLKCPKCGSILQSTENFCTNCGTSLKAILSEPKVLVTVSDFDPMYANTEEVLLEEFINKELAYADIDKNSKLMPDNVLKRKHILHIIFTILVFVYVSLIFFHCSLAIYIFGGIILFIFNKVSKKYNLMDYLKKEVKARPSEKISNIIMNVKNSFVEDKSLKLKRISIIIAIILPLIIFMNPRIMYEKVHGGYAVRFYTFGVTNFDTVTIPKRYKGEDVVSLRGNTFSNMPFLKEVKLPDTITEIRGQAFKNDISLKEINIPSNLEYLGGGAFYNCSSIKSISLPDTLTYMGGEVFYGASSLEEIKLSENLSEIRGNSFEECGALESIEIPDNVERIGGHAFYGASSLSEVTLTENSKLKEIGSSAFRKCSKLENITLPYDVFVDPKAFKESPTVVKHFNTDYDSYYSSN